MDKLSAYKLLFEIKKEKSIDVTNQVKELASIKDLKESVPISVMLFINDYKSIPSLETINYIHENCKSNKLYKRLVNENQNTDQKAIALIGFMNQCSQKLKYLSENYERNAYIEDLKLMVIVDALQQYYKGNSKAIDETFDIVRNLIKSVSKGGSVNE